MKKNFLVISALLILCAALAFAAIDGTWTNAAGTGQVPQTLHVQMSGSVLTGNVDSVGITGGKIEGSTIWFSYTRGGTTYKYKGSVNGNFLNLYESRTGVAGGRQLQFTRTGN
jgi:hypothetical protein